MNRVDAARLLGVTANASKRDITAAFRIRAKAAHPDAVSSPGSSRPSAKTAEAGATMATLVEARDLLLRPQAPVASAGTVASQGAAAPPGGWPPTTDASRVEDWTPGRSPLMVAGVVAGVCALVAVVVLTAVGLGLLSNSAPAETPANDASVPSLPADGTDTSSDADLATGCVLVTQLSANERSFAAADCARADAWEIASWTEGLAACPATKEAIRTAEGTWCLTPPHER